MARIKALVTPSVMKWARERARFDVETAASKIGRPLEEISAWEDGSLQPSMAQARKASEVYKRSLSIFYLPEPPEDFATLRDFRTLPETVGHEYSPELALLVRRLQVRQQWLREFLLTEGHDPLEFAGSASEISPADQVAKSIRSTLGIAINDQVACNTSRDALNLWVERAEASGVYVCREGKIDSTEARGAALTDDIAPFVYVNSNDSYSARLFTLVHELAHLWINKPGLSNLEGIKRQAKVGDAAIEAFCNRVAAQSLMSEKQFSSLWDSRDASYPLPKQIDIIADYFNVSGEVVARRLLDRRIIRTVDYEQLRTFFHKRWLKHKDEEKKKQKESKGGPSFYVQRLHSNGRSLTQTVLGACNAGSVSLRDACAVLNVKVGHLPKLAEVAGMKQSPVAGGSP